MDTISKESIPQLLETNAGLGFREFKAKHYAAATLLGQEYHVDGLAHHGVTLTENEYAAALMGNRISPMPVLMKPVPAPLDNFTAVESQRNKDKVAYVDKQNKMVATINQGLVILRCNLLLGLNQESLGALQSIHGHF